MKKYKVLWIGRDFEYISPSKTNSTPWDPIQSVGRTWDEYAADQAHEKDYTTYNYKKCLLIVSEENE